MSIVTLKKKTNATYQTMSTNKTQFSLNGNYRNQGYVGQNLISRSTSCISSTEDIRYTKKSVVGNTGMLMTKYRWIRRPQPFTSVKKDDGKLLHDQNTYIQQLTQKTIDCPSSKKSKNDIISAKCMNAKTANKHNIPVITKPENFYSILGQDLYIKGLSKKCAMNDFNDGNTVNYGRTPFYGFN